MFSISSDFVGDFKLGDNINHTLKVLAYMYECQGEDREAWVLRKPIIVLIASVVEAVLHDLHLRMRTYTIEGVKGVADSVLEYVRGKKIDKLDHYITSARKHSLLGPETDGIYDDLDELRRLRNRIHIQNEKNDYEANDSQAFSSERQQTAEQSLEKLLKTISNNHPRAEGARGHVADFELPWDEHFEDAERH